MKVMLLGDSIRQNYEDRVRELLETEYEVSSPAENGRFAGYTLNSLRHWLNDLPKPDIIHWNNGLWDVYHIPHENRCFTTADEYIEKMRRAYDILRLKGAKIVLATTTPVIEHPTAPDRFNRDIIEYNERLLSEFTGKVDAINDLHALLLPCLKENLLGDGVHLSPEGIRLCAAAIAKSVTQFHN